MRKYIYLLLFTALFIGCSPSKTEIRDVKIPVPAIVDTIPAVWVDTGTLIPVITDSIPLLLPDTSSYDGFYYGESEDKKIKVKYYPKKKQFVVDVKPDSVVYKDTTKVVLYKSPPPKEKPFYEVIIGGIITILVLYLIIIGVRWLVRK